MITKKLILTSFAIFVFINAFAQILPPVNVWTPGGGNIYFNGGNVGIGLNSPLYPLHVQGDAFFSKGISASTIASTFLRTDTLQTGVIKVPSGSAFTVNSGADFSKGVTAKNFTSGSLYTDTIKSAIINVPTGHNLRINGVAIISGNLSSASYRISGLAGTGDRNVYVDSSGNLRVNPGVAYPNAACIPGAPSWVFGGNNLSSTNFPDTRIGTCDMSDFVLMAHSVSSICIKPSGYVGIGTSSPAAHLTINVNDQAPALVITNYNNTLRFLGNGTGDIASSGSLRPHFGVSADFSVYEGIPGSGALRLQVASGGEVTIPQLVSGSNGSQGPYHTLMVDGTGKLISTTQMSQSVNGLAWVLGGNANTGGSATLGTTDPNGYSFIVNNSPCIALTSAGNVHVVPHGVTTQIIPNGAHINALFSVSGEAIFKSAFVNVMTWSDYVFDKNYKLMALDEVEKYYLQNKHLPGVPSAKEMIVNGDNIAETDATLLKKIEELTMYMVEQQRQIKILEQKLQEVQK